MLQLGSFYAAQTPGHTIELQMSFCYFHILRSSPLKRTMSQKHKDLLLASCKDQALARVSAKFEWCAF